MWYRLSYRVQARTHLANLLSADGNSWLIPLGRLHRPTDIRRIQFRGSEANQEIGHIISRLYNWSIVLPLLSQIAQKSACGYGPLELGNWMAIMFVSAFIASEGYPLVYIYIKYYMMPILKLSILTLLYTLSMAYKW